MSTHPSFSDFETRPVVPLPLSLEDITSYMTQRARELVHELVNEKGQEEPPFLSEELAKLQGIKEIIKTDLGELDALLYRQADGYVIKVNANHHPARQNFSCAHEIGHTFLHELALQDTTDSAEFRILNSNIGGKTKERLCHDAAAELLMPEWVFKRYLAGFGVSANSIERLAYTFRVSIPATAIRIAEVSTEPCIAILWKRWQKAKSEGFLPSWCAGPGRKAQDRGYHISKPTYVRDQSALALVKAYESDELVRSFKSFEIGGIRKRCSMESKGFGRDKWRYVISLVFPER